MTAGSQEPQPAHGYRSLPAPEARLSGPSLHADDCFARLKNRHRTRRGSNSRAAR